MPIAITLLIIIFSLILFTGFILLRIFILGNFNKLKPKDNSFTPVLQENKILLRDQYILDTKYKFFNNKNDFIIVFVHGLGAHIHELKWFADFCTKNKFSHLIYSRRNCGINLETQKENFQLGEEVFDCLDVIKILENKFPEKRIILIGHSLGAALLSALVARFEVKTKKVEFIIINPPTDLNSLNPFNFVEKKTSSVLRLGYGIFFNKNVVIRPIPKYFPILIYCNAMCNNDRLSKVENFFNFQKKYNKESEYFLMKNYYHLRKLPLYYYINCFNLFRNTFTNIKKNYVNKIWICQSEYDYFGDIDKVNKEERKLKDHENINFIYIENFYHRFEAEKPEQNEAVMEQIFNKVLKK